ncbi:histidine phosphatase family protein [Methylocella sp.]|uniref:histidine phosphatase family protein n=1 Tax=Methylocella sp. TaxID=1978226 RepID=UPI0035B0DF33
MSPRLILARHGDTFAPGEKVVFVGARSDPPLTARGREQARAGAAELSRRGLAPDRVLCGPLRRTREAAEIFAETLGAPAPEPDARLTEIDHGAWEGKSAEEIRALWGETAFLAYDRDGAWPQAAGFSPPRATLLARVDALLDEAAAGRGAPLYVTSNGVLRLFGTRAGARPEAAKMRTGALSLLSLDADGARIEFWNVSPERG